jgi:hypothetical protein
MYVKNTGYTYIQYGEFRFLNSCELYIRTYRHFLENSWIFMGRGTCQRAEWIIPGYGMERGGRQDYPHHQQAESRRIKAGEGGGWSSVMPHYQGEMRKWEGGPPFHRVPLHPVCAPMETPRLPLPPPPDPH